MEQARTAVKSNEMSFFMAIPSQKISFAVSVLQEPLRTSCNRYVHYRMDLIFRNWVKSEKGGTFLTLFEYL
jgi:hypothetical protein